MWESIHFEQLSSSSPFFLLFNSVSNLYSLTFCFFCFSFSLSVSTRIPHTLTAVFLSSHLSNLYISVLLSINIPSLLFILSLFLVTIILLYSHTKTFFSFGYCTLQQHFILLSYISPLSTNRNTLKKTMLMYVREKGVLCLPSTIPRCKLITGTFNVRYSCA